MTEQGREYGWTASQLGRGKEREDVGIHHKEWVQETPWKYLEAREPDQYKNASIMGILTGI